MKPISRRFLLAGAPVSLGAAYLSYLRWRPHKTLPRVQIGHTCISRLIAGGNPVGGFAHQTMRMRELMSQHFTLRRTVQHLLHCEHEGITVFHSHWEPKIERALRYARDLGCEIQWMCVTADRHKQWNKILPCAPMAICHHGHYTDEYVRAGNPGPIHDFVKRVHDFGALAGISSHDPQTIRRIEGMGWEHDFYMAGLHNLSRTPEDITKILGGDHPIGTSVDERVMEELYLASDPPAMLNVVREVTKPCLVFKILAAGRLCTSKKAIDAAFRNAFASIKPSDCVIVGMFPIVSDEVAEDAELVRRYGAATGVIT